MKVKAKKTMKNAYDQVLFFEGKEYEVEEEGVRYIYIINELHWETEVRLNKLEENFERC